MSHCQLRGAGVSPGIAIGEPVVHENRPISTVRITLQPEQVNAEVERFKVAVTTAVERILENRDRAGKAMGDEYAAIFEAHHLIASDPSLIDPVVEVIKTEQVNAEWALDQIVGLLVAKFEALPDLDLADRKLDVLDVATQIMGSLHGLDLRQLDLLDRPFILVADDLPPSTAVQLPLQRVLGFVLETGGPTSHTTIIARSFGIPVIVGAHGACAAAKQSRRIAFDAFEGKIIFDPIPAEVSEFRSRQREYQEQQSNLFQMRVMPAVTRDGHQVELLANIDLPLEVDQALQWNVAGIGLYRSEFLFMRLSPGLPDEDEQLAVYREIAAKMGHRSVTIRTFDLGGKKLARDLIGSPEANPVLGLRGIRLCFSEMDFFRRQLRALLRLAGERPPGTIRIMFPLISGLEEFRLARLLATTLNAELREEGYTINENIPLGAMVEVPSAAVMAHELAREADFLSVGTNDLIQYSLAVDRSNDLVAHLYKPTSPAILKLIANVIQAGEDEGVDISMCGEMASDPLMVPLLIGLGLRRFSMNPQAVPVIRSLVRQLSYRESVHLARQAQTLVTARDVEELLLERLAISLAKTRIRV